jgi:adenylate cyclase
LISDLDRALKSTKLTPELGKRYEEAKTDVPVKFGGTGDMYDKLAGIRKEPGEALPGSACFIGWTGTSTTDIGTTAFSKDYYNVGLHATIRNSILVGSFLDILPWGLGAALALLFSLLLAYVIRNMRPGFAILTGAGFVVGIIVAGSGYFYATGVYPNVLTPTLAVFFSFIIRTFTLFMQTAKEKSFIRNAFSRYLSTDVINQLVNDPSKLELGGESKPLTAIFTDIKGFSTISEISSPTDLVKRLNRYLTEVSNIILSRQGDNRQVRG